MKTKLLLWMLWILDRRVVRWLESRIWALLGPKWADRRVSWALYWALKR